MKSMVEESQSQRPGYETAGNQSSGPLFVVGMWRSGTSLLYALLNQHPDISLMYEDDLPLLWPMFVGGKPKADWFARWDFWNNAPRRHKLDPSFATKSGTLKEILECIYRSAGTAIWGAKSPNYYDRMAHLARIFPKARFLVIWRDLEGICSSVVRAGNKPSWFSRGGMVHRTILGYRRMKTERDRLVAAGMPIHEISYEKLVSEPEATMKGICQFLHVPFDPNMCSLINADRSAIFAHDHHVLVNSSKIVHSQKRTEVLSSAVKRKIARYYSLWREEHAGWPVYGNQEADSAKPSRMERLVDRLIDRTLRAWDLGIVFIYCYAPMRLLGSYRAVKQIRSGVKTGEAPKPVESQTVSSS